MWIGDFPSWESSCGVYVVGWFSGHCRATKSQNLHHKAIFHSLYNSLLLIQMQNISLRSSGMRRKQNFDIKMTQQSWLLLFAFSPPFFFRFSCLIFFSFAGHLVGFILVGKVFRISGLDERKGRWVVEQDFHGSFQVNFTWFLAFLSGDVDWIVLILVWFERFIHSAQVRGQRCLKP